MKLTYNGLLNKAYWQERGYQLPLYDIPRVRAAADRIRRFLRSTVRWRNTVTVS